MSMGCTDIQLWNNQVYEYPHEALDVQQGVAFALVLS